MSESTCDQLDAAPGGAGAPEQMDAAGLGPYGTWPYVDRRVQPDRRLMGTRLFSRYLLQGKRVGGRRAGENRNLYVDRFHPGDLLLTGGILVLNILDAWFTLNYLGKGGSEANPIARFLMEQGSGWFVFSKAVVVALCVLFLMMHKTFHLVRPALWTLLGFYTLLLGYHIYLQVGLIMASRM